MELAHFLSMVQFEVLKSFEYAAQLQNDLNMETGNEIQLGMQGVSVDIPVILGSEKKEIKLKDLKPHTAFKERISITNLEMPFSKQISHLETQFEAGKTAEKVSKKRASKKTVSGDVITVQVAGPASTNKEGYDNSLIGKIHMEIKPIIK